MNYYYEVDRGTKWKCTVIEVATENVMKKDIPFHDAVSYVNLWNGGVGFDGWTPSFLLQAVGKRF